MKKRMLSYLAKTDALLGGGAQDWRELRAEHLTQIAFFQHERLIHLIVTCLFALMEVMVLAVAVFSFSIGALALCLLILALLIPYVRHYYLLENGVQRMYGQYDRMTELMNAQSDRQEEKNI